MPTQVEAAPSARSWKSSAGYQVLWNGIIQSAAEPDFLIVFLFSISGLLFSLFLALSVKLTYDRGRGSRVFERLPTVRLLLQPPRTVPNAQDRRFADRSCR